MLHDPGYGGIPPSEVLRLIKKGAVLVDVRTQCEYAGYHIEGSINIPYNEIERMKEFIKNETKPVITFSSHGRRSEIAALKLKALGVEVYNAGTIHQIELSGNGENEYEEFSRSF